MVQFKLQLHEQKTNLAQYQVQVKELHAFPLQTIIVLRIMVKLFAV